MRFKLYSLVDITETGQHRGPDKLAMDQQANFNTLIQVIGLRANPTPIKIKQLESDISKLGFGKDFNGKHKYWEFEFEVEYGFTSVEMLNEDFDMVPIISNLTESATIEIPVFHTKNDKNRNVTFENID